MPYLIDTNVAIHLRDLDGEVARSLAALGQFPMLSVVTRVELEGGVQRDPPLARFRRARLDAMLAELSVLPFDDAAGDAYGRIVTGIGYSRRLILDRMIAATALAAGATLITMNGDDFTGIPGLQLKIWPSPAADQRA